MAEALKTNATVTELNIHCEWGVMMMIGNGSAVFVRESECECMFV